MSQVLWRCVAVLVALSPATAAYAYVQATVDVAAQRLIVSLDGQAIDEHRYRLR